MIPMTIESGKPSFKVIHCLCEAAICERLNAQAHCDQCPDIYVRALDLLSFSEQDAKRLGVSILPLRHVDPDFSCPYTKMRLLTHCMAKTCRWWVPFIHSGNCLLAYISKHHSEDLRDAEIAFLLGESKTEVLKELSLSLRRLRSKALTEDVLVDAPKDPNYLKPNKGHCCVCGRRVLFAELKDDGFIYCGDDCYDAKPPTVIRVEMKYNCRIELLLQHVLRIFKDPYAAMQALGLPYGVYFKLARNISSESPTKK